MGFTIGTFRFPLLPVSFEFYKTNPYALTRFNLLQTYDSGTDPVRVSSPTKYEPRVYPIDNTNYITAEGT